MMARTTIKLIGLEGIGHHGVYEFEKSNGQKFIVDAELEIETPKDDDLNQTVNYGTLARNILNLVEGEAVDLIETLAKRILDLIMSDDLVLRAKVIVHKPDAPMQLEFADVQVCVSAARNEVS